MENEEIKDDVVEEEEEVADVAPVVAEEEVAE